MDENEEIQDLEPAVPAEDAGSPAAPVEDAVPVEDATPVETAAPLETTSQVPAPAAAPQAPAREHHEEESTGGVSFRTQGERNDGSAELVVSPDGMLVEASFFPAMGEGKPLSPDDVKNLLAGLGIVAGILWDEIAEAVMRCNLDRRILHGVVVARGFLPVPEIPPHAALEPKFRRTGPLVDENVQRVDFRELSGVFVVRKDEAIARIIPRREGAPGSDVRGAEVPYPRESPENYVAGRNVVQREDRLASAVDGRLLVTGNRLDVDEVLLIKGGVDYHTGHIAFPGDVVIEGQVRDGFRVRSGGSIVCKTTLDAFDVEAKKNLECPQGIIGRARAQIRVGGDLNAKYVQNCKVAVRGNVRVPTAIVNSKILCLGMIDLGDKGVVMGGELHALHGLRCGRLGNQAMQRTVVRAGIDFTVEQRLAQANERMRLISARSRQIEAAGRSRPGPELERARAEIAKAADAVRALITELLGKLDADDSAVIEAKGEIFPGVVIEICRVSIVVGEKLKAGTFKLDKAAGRIVIGK